jgi:hypothetical protein
MVNKGAKVQNIPNKIVFHSKFKIIMKKELDISADIMVLSWEFFL